jgi:hypothetical protein
MINSSKRENCKGFLTWWTKNDLMFSFLQIFANLDGMAAAGIAIYSKMMIWERSKK